jgi:tetratricopeptide (TPR) repeat protein
LANREILDSWKEISVYLNRSVKTCQRWEKEYNLPIHRLDGSPKSSVFAYKDEVDRWRERTLRGGERPTTQFLRRKKTLRIMMLAAPVLLLAVLVLVIWRPWSGSGEFTAREDKPLIAILYFENPSQDESLEAMRTYLADLTITALLQSKLVKVISSAGINGILRKLGLEGVDRYDSKDLTRISDETAAEFIAFATLSRFGNWIITNYQIYHAGSGNIINAERSEFTQESALIGLPDNIARLIRQDLGLSEEQITQDQIPSIQSVTSASWEAHQLYAEGQRYYNLGDYEHAAGFYRRVLAADPDFAQVYVSLGWAEYLGMMGGKGRRYYAEIAYSLRERVPEYERRYIEAMSHIELEGDRQKAIDIYTRMLERDPFDNRAHFQLGVQYIFTEDIEKAIEHGEIVVGSNTHIANAWSNLSWAYEMAGNYKRSEELLVEYLKRYPENPMIWYELGGLLVKTGRLDQGLEYVKRGFNMNPTMSRAIYTLAHVHIYRREFREAEEVYQQLIGSQNLGYITGGLRSLAQMRFVEGKFKEAEELLLRIMRMRAEAGKSASGITRFLAQVYHSQGRLEEALEYYEKWLESGKSSGNNNIIRHALHYKGLVLADQGRFEEALQTAEELKGFVQLSTIAHRYMRLYYNLLGIVELRRENFSRAAVLFKQAFDLHPKECFGYFIYAIFVDPMADAHMQLNELDQAQEYYEMLSMMTDGRLFVGDIWAKSFYKLGQLHERKGEKDQAITYYEKFLGLWKDADPGLDEVEDARDRLAALDNY